MSAAASEVAAASGLTRDLSPPVITYKPQYPPLPVETRRVHVFPPTTIPEELYMLWWPPEDGRPGHFVRCIEGPEAGYDYAGTFIVAASERDAKALCEHYNGYHKCQCIPIRVR